ALARAQAADLMGQLLDGQCSDLETGAFCIAMRIKGETPPEMAGFLDAIDQRLHKVPVTDAALPVVVLPCYNGARKLPALAALLALLLARQGWPVLVHGADTQTRQASTRDVLAQLGIAAASASAPLRPGQVRFVATEALHPGLARLLQARWLIGLRNPAHSLVKLMNPAATARALVVGSYTHPAYAETMRAAFALRQQPAMLLRGTEGEPVADARRAPAMQILLPLQEADCLTEPGQTGTLAALPDLPRAIDAASTAQYIRAVLDGQTPAPAPIARQAALIARACQCLQDSSA
ncbi:MAG: DNA-binding protein YbiB, partial [Burkholderiaceae bacterium]|nr:DNA-binding protein YbiB [Burkholderiaceae bacterium]